MAINNILNNTLVGQSGNGQFVGTDRPSMSNPFANNFNNGMSTIVTAADTTVLTVTSNQVQYFTGATTQTVTLPVVSTLYLGQTYVIVNGSTGLITVNSSGANPVVVVPAGSTATVRCVLLTGTTAASWNSQVASAAPPPASIAWVAVSGTTQAAAVDTGYILNNVAATTVTLPATAAVGSRVIIKGGSTANWTLTANAGQTLRFGNIVTPTGGSMTSNVGTDSVQLTCIVANTTWVVDYAVSAGLNLV